jgi:hypothetical protein
MSGPQFVVPNVFQMPRDISPPLDVYANQIRLGATLQDFTIILGTTEDLGIGQIGTKDRVVVRLAPATAKLLQLHLAAAVEAYEEAIGPIAMSESLGTQLATVKEKIVAAYKQQMQTGPVVPTTPPAEGGP